MTFRTLIRRSLRFHARAHLGVVLGAAIGSAALIGALVVGDSVRLTLRDRALSRLGRIHFALNSRERFFRQSLGRRFEFGTSEALLLPGMAARQDESARANQVQVLGVEPETWFELASRQHPPVASPQAPSNNGAVRMDDRPAPPPGLSRETFDRWQAGEIVLVNETLARKLLAHEGDEIILRVRKPALLAQDAVISPRDQNALALRLKVGPVLPAGLLGDFSLSANQAPPANAFLPLDFLATKAKLPGQANLMVCPELSRLPRPGQVKGLRYKLTTWLWRLGWPAKWLPAEPLTPPPLLKVGETKPSSEALADLAAGLEARWRLEDAGLSVRTIEPPAGPAQGEPARPWVEVTSSRIFLEPQVVKAALTPRTRPHPGQKIESNTGTNKLAAGQFGTNAARVLTYVANLIRAGNRATPYSMVTAADPPFVLPDMRDDEILVNQWLADDLRVKPGDSVSLSYYVVDSGARLIERTNSFRVRAIVPLEGLYADRTLMPEFPGLAEAESTRDWDAGFPLKYKIRPQDEAYWKQYRGTPKAFITLAAGQKMWANRFGSLTAIRYPVPVNTFPIQCQVAVYRNLVANLNPADLGLRFEPVREQALRAAEQGQDFGQLFLGFSLFLVVAALVLMALLFQFGLEQRATEVGTLLALGFTPKQVRRLLLGEGTALALVGGVLGAAGGLAYARAMIWGLDTVWNSAIGAAQLHFHATAPTLVIGFSASTLVAVLTIWLALRKQARLPVYALLAGDVQGPKSKVQSPESRVQGPKSKVALVCGVGAVAIVGWAMAKGETANAGAFFGAGSLVLLAGLAQAAAWLEGVSQKITKETKRRNTLAALEGDGRSGLPERNPHTTEAASESSSFPSFPSVQESPFSLADLGLRGCARRRQRSLATIALLSCGCFVIAAIGVFRLDANRDATRRSSGTGGFALLGETTLPVLHDLNTQSGREAFGLDPADPAGVRVVPFRVRAGDDASCLNLNRAQKPRLLGVDPALLAGRFTFAKVAKGAERRKGWSLLKRAPQTSSPDEVPAIGDAESLQWALGKKVGDTIDYTDEQGRPFKLRLVGAVASSILQGNLIIDETQFVKRFPSESGYRYFLLDAPSNSVPQVSATLSRALQDLGMELTPAVQRLNAFNAIQNTYLGTFQILGGLGLLLGSMGLGVVVLRNVLERRGELALLLAVGFRRRTLEWLVLAEHGVLLGYGLGLGLVAAAVAVLPAVLTPGTQLPLGSLALTLGAVLLNGALWTWLATRYALRGNLLEALRNE